MQNKRRCLLSAVLLIVVVGLFLVPQTVPTQAQQQNLLTNPGFEAPYSDGVATGWGAWYEDSGDLCSSKPSNWDFVCRPGWSEEGDWSNLGLKRSGNSSQHVGVQYITWHGGVFQTVQVPAGSTVRFTAYGYSRASNDQPPAASFGGNWVPRMQVGIDPEGRGAWNQGVIWSAENNNSDSWQAQTVETTVGQSGKVTVFVSTKFRMIQPLAHLDSWWDDAVLEVVQPAVPPTATPQPTSAIPPTPRATSTPRPDGAVVHVVQANDTLYGIALQYNVDVDEIRRLNAGTIGADSILYIGQEVVISGAPLAEPTPVPTAEPTAEPTQAPGEEPTAPPQSGDLGSFCVSAYHDRSNDMIRQPDTEELLPNITVTLVGTNGPAGTYTTDGISEPHCFQNLQPGNYVLRQTPPAGYQPTGPSEWGVMLGAGEVSSLQLGYVRDTEGTTDQPTAEATTDAPTTGEETDGSLSNILNIILQVSGIVVLVLALLVAGLFIISRRK